MTIYAIHAAAKAIEADGIEGFNKARQIIGDEVAFALLVAHIRRGYGSMGSWPADPDIDPKTNGLLSENLPEMYAFLSQPIAPFYSRRWYCFDNFSTFSVEMYNRVFATAEHAYQASKYVNLDGSFIVQYADSDGEFIADTICNARSAHEAKKLGRHYQEFVRKDWCDTVKRQVMKVILRTKAAQHDYVQKELAASKGMLLVEDSDKDSFWGRGPDWNGANNLGTLWMEIRDE